MSRTRTRDVDVRGHALDAVVTAVAALAPATRMRVQRILGERNLLHVTTDEWYPMDAVLDALDAVENAAGPSVLRRLGMQATVFTWEAAGAETPAEAISRLQAAYESAHHGQQAGGFRFEYADETRGRVVSTTPYPDAFDRGLLDATFTGDGEMGIFARVTPLDDATPGDRHGTSTQQSRRRGDGETRYEISW